MQTVKEVSAIGRGKHTTRTISLLELPSGGFLADTPGFNLPDLSAISSQDLPLLFPEVVKLAESGESCRFSNCRHITEPGCVIRSADWERYPMYIKLLKEIEARETYDKQVLQMSKKTRQGRVKRKVRKGGRYHEEVLLEAKTHRRISRTKVSPGNHVLAPNGGPPSEMNNEIRSPDLDNDFEDAVSSIYFREDDHSVITPRKNQSSSEIETKEINTSCQPNPYSSTDSCEICEEEDHCPNDQQTDPSLGRFSRVPCQPNRTATGVQSRPAPHREEETEIHRRKPENNNNNNSISAWNVDRLDIPGLDWTQRLLLIKESYEKRKALFIDDLSFIREVQGGISLAPEMDIGVELKNLAKMFKRWKTEFKIVTQESIWEECVASENCEELKFAEKIGEGSYGKIYKVEDPESGATFAVKEIATSGERGTGYPNPFRIENEADIHESVSDSPSVASFIGHVKKEKSQCIAMELCEGGSLTTFVEQNGPMNERQVAAVARSAVDTIETFHSRKIFHGDIKAGNFVIGKSENVSKLKHNPDELQIGWLKAIDFGCSKRMGMSKITNKVGTPTHWPPEVFAEKYGLEADLWSLGTMLYKLIARHLPYFTKKEQMALQSHREILLGIITKELDLESGPWTNISQECKDFIRKLLSLQAEKRMTACEAKQHPFLKQGNE
eukprot:g8512.t1